MNEISLIEISLIEISLMMKEDIYVSQLQNYTTLIINNAKEKAFQYTFINFSPESSSFEKLSSILYDLISQQILSNEEIELPKLCLTPNKDKYQRNKELKTLYKLLVSFYVYQFHNLFLLYHYHPKAIDTEEFIQYDLERLEIPDEIVEKNETALMIANSQDRFQQNNQKGLSWAKTLF